MARSTSAGERPKSAKRAGRRRRHTPHSDTAAATPQPPAASEDRVAAIEDHLAAIRQLLEEAAKRERMAHVPLLGLTREEAAYSIRVSPSTFDKMVDDGRMPQPRRIGTRTVWDVREVAEAWQRLKDGGDAATPGEGDVWDQARA